MDIFCGFSNLPLNNCVLDVIIQLIPLLEFENLLIIKNKLSKLNKSCHLDDKLCKSAFDILEKKLNQYR